MEGNNCSFSFRNRGTMCEESTYVQFLSVHWPTFFYLSYWWTNIWNLDCPNVEGAVLRFPIFQPVSKIEGVLNISFWNGLVIFWPLRTVFFSCEWFFLGDNLLLYNLKNPISILKKGFLNIFWCSSIMLVSSQRKISH